MRTFRYIIFFILLALAAKPVSAQEDNPELMDFLDYVQSTEIPKKGMKDICSHFERIRAVLANMGHDIVAENDGLGLKWIVPASDLFAPNDTVLKADISPHIDILKEMLQYPTMYKVVVGVFTDNTGDSDYRTALTEGRALAVSDYLYALAPVADANITVFAIPEGGYIVPNNSIANRSRNRRVEIHIVPEKEMISMSISGKLH